MNAAAQKDLLRAGRKQPWLKLFLEFITKLRIDSKEESAEDDRGSPLILWDSQRRLLEEICRGLDQGIRTFYVLKSRQLGVTTISLAIDLFWLSVHPRIIGALVSDTPENRDTFIDTLKRYIRSFPPGYLSRTDAKWKHSANRLLLPNQSRLDYPVAGKRSTTWGEGRGYAFAHLTELAKYGQPAGIQSFIESMAQENPDRLFIVESTADGLNHWADMWNSAEHDPTIVRIFIGWWAQPTNRVKKSDPRFARFGIEPPNGEEAKLIHQVSTRFGHVVTQEQLAWYRWRQTRQDRQSLDQNQPWTPEQAFVMGGYSFFQAERIQQRYEAIKEANSRDPAELLFKAYRYEFGSTFWQTKMEQIFDAARLEDVELRVWEDPVKEGLYVIGDDPSFTREEWSSNNVSSVWRAYADRLVQVAEFCTGRAETEQAAWVLAHLAGAYRNCLVNIDLQGPGRVVMTAFNAVRQQLRADVYQARRRDYGWDDFLENCRWYLYHRPDSPSAGYVYNFETNWSRKWELMNAYRDNFISGTLDIRSVLLLQEMATMVQDKSTIAPRAPGNLKDDRVFAAALATRAYLEHLQPQLLAQGAFYDIVTRRELGIPDGPTDMVDRLVYSWFQRREQQATEEEEYEPPSWMRDRGFAA